jgi:hypothetical protein
MARRHYGERRDDWVGCCRRYQAEAITSGIAIMRSRAIAWQNPEITSDEVWRTFVPEHLQDMAKQVRRHFSISSAYLIQHQWDDPKIVLDIRIARADWAPPKKPTILRGPGWDKIQAWCQWRYERGCEWGLVREVWNRLDTLCRRERSNQLHVVRYLWPTVLTLLEVGGETEDAAKLRSTRPPDNLPRISPDLKEAMCVTAGTVAATSLLPAAIPENDWPVKLDMRSYGGPSPRLDNVSYTIM